MRGLLGSTASTASVRPGCPSSASSVLASRLLPTPGGPVSATTRAGAGQGSAPTVRRISGSPDSTRVIARASTRRSPPERRDASEDAADPVPQSPPGSRGFAWPGTGVGLSRGGRTSPR